MRRLLLNPHRLEPAGARHLRQPLGVVRIALVDPGRQHALGMPGTDANRRQAAPSDEVFLNDLILAQSMPHQGPSTPSLEFQN